MSKEPDFLARLQFLATQHPSALLALAAAVLTAILYGGVLRLPLYVDDVMMLRIVRDHGLLELLLPLQNWNYYRPLNLIPYKILRMLVGSNPPWAMHFISASFHAVNAWLVGLLARRLIPDRPLGWWITSAFYLTFPFTYEAVHWSAALGHVTVGTGLLIGGIFLLRWWESARWGNLITAWLGVFLAAFSHESGIMAVGVMGVLLFFGPNTGRIKTAWENRRRLILALVPAGLVNLLYLLVRWLNPYPLTGGHLDFWQIPLKVTYFGQGLVFPLAQFGGWISRFGIDERMAAYLLVAFGALTLISLIIGLKLRAAWTSFAWFGVAILPSVLFLELGYVLSGPRFMIAPSIGAALLWGTLLDALWERLPRYGRLIPVGLCLLALGGGGWFILSRMPLHDRLIPLYEQIFEDSLNREHMAVFNMPAWIAPRDKVYPLGSEGVNYVGVYRLKSVIWANTGIEPDIIAYLWQDTYPALIGYVGEVITPEDTDYPGIRQNLQGMDLVKRVVTVNESWYWVDSYPLEEIPADSRTFENGASVHAEAFHYRSAPIVQLDLIWGIGEPFDASVFVHLLCGETIIAQGDGVPLGGFYPFVLWQTDEIRYESRLLGYEPGMDPACLQIRLGLYDSVSGERLRFEDGSDSLTIPVSTESDRG